MNFRFLLLCGLLSAPTLVFCQTEEIPPEPQESVSVLTQITFRTVIMEMPKTDSFPVTLRKSWKPWVCPGLGHFEIKEPVKGSVLIGLFGTSLAASLSFGIASRVDYREHQTAAAEALSETDYEERERKMTEAVRLYDRANIFKSWSQAALVAAGVVWTYGLFDYHYSLSRNGTGWAVIPRTDGVSLCLQKGF